MIIIILVAPLWFNLQKQQKNLFLMFYFEGHCLFPALFTLEVGLFFLLLNLWLVNVPDFISSLIKDVCVPRCSLHECDSPSEQETAVSLMNLIWHQCCSNAWIHACCLLPVEGVSHVCVCVCVTTQNSCVHMVCVCVCVCVRLCEHNMTDSYICSSQNRYRHRWSSSLQFILSSSSFVFENIYLGLFFRLPSILLHKGCWTHFLYFKVENMCIMYV